METEVKCGFGPHLILYCYGCSKERLSDIDFIRSLLDSFPEELEMKKVMPPNVFKYRSKISEEWGVSGVVLTGDSHISIHTFPDKEYVFVDIFSSRDFNADQARERVIESFAAKDHEIKLLGH